MDLPENRRVPGRSSLASSVLKGSFGRRFPLHAPSVIAAPGARQSRDSTASPRPGKGRGRDSLFEDLLAVAETTASPTPSPPKQNLEMPGGSARRRDVAVRPGASECPPTLGSDSGESAGAGATEEGRSCRSVSTRRSASPCEARPSAGVPSREAGAASRRGGVFGLLESLASAERRSLPGSSGKVVPSEDGGVAAGGAREREVIDIKCPGRTGARIDSTSQGKVIEKTPSPNLTSLKENREGRSPRTVEQQASPPSSAHLTSLKENREGRSPRVVEPQSSPPSAVNGTGTARRVKLIQHSIGQAEVPTSEGRTGRHEAPDPLSRAARDASRVVHGAGAEPSHPSSKEAPASIAGRPRLGGEAVQMQQGGGPSDSSRRNGEGPHGGDPRAPSSPSVVDLPFQPTTKGSPEAAPSSVASAVERVQRAAHDYPRATGRMIEVSASGPGDRDVRVSARLEGGAVRAEIAASDPATQATLLRNLDDMQRHLGRLGITVASIAVRFEDAPERRDGKDQRQDDLGRPAAVGRRETRSRSLARRAAAGVDYVA